MTRKEKVFTLFEFLMELLEENEPKDVKKPLINENKPMSIPQTVNVNSSLELMKKIDEIEKEKATERFKTRMVNNATRPILEELKTLKKAAHDNAMHDKEIEQTTESINYGLTLVDGKPNVVPIPNILRDNIPLNDNDLANINNSFTPSEPTSKKEIIKPLESPVSKKPKVEKAKIKKTVNKKPINKKSIVSKNKRK